MREKTDGHGKETIALFRLSTGYEVPICFDGVMGKDMKHLANALIGEFTLAGAKEHGWDKAVESMVSEIADCVLRLPEQEKNNLLRAIVFQFVLKRWAELERRIKPPQ